MKRGRGGRLEGITTDRRISGTTRRNDPLAATDPRQDDYDIWLGTTVLGIWISWKRHGLWITPRKIGPGSSVSPLHMVILTPP